MMEVTPNCVPYCVAWLKLNVMFIACAPSGGLKPANAKLPLAGAVTRPVFENVRVCAAPTCVPLTVILTVH